MKKSQKTKILIALLLLNLVWCTGLVIVGDFYPHLKTLENVLITKSIINGLISISFMAAYFEQYWNSNE